ncbi:hypothetical protein [Spartinivicinus ruber]|uniref:hypothetical protein n=1 Tax=Spartinivicinus ruber TaxID=2683272 RepID=UPI0013D412BF|nr:hypothetical protein [Spartinivicinus ruber]
MNIKASIIISSALSVGLTIGLLTSNYQSLFSTKTVTTVNAGSPTLEQTHPDQTQETSFVTHKQKQLKQNNNNKSDLNKFQSIDHERSQILEKVTIVENGNLVHNYPTESEDKPSLLDIISPASKQLKTVTNYSFPEIIDLGNNEYTLASIGEALPGISKYRKVNSQENNASLHTRVNIGDTVAIKYNMYSWKSGKKVESTQDQFGGPLELVVGSKKGQVTIPKFLNNTIMGSRVGERYQVVFETGMKDLPNYLDKDDAYILVVDIVNKN